MNWAELVNHPYFQNAVFGLGSAVITYVCTRLWNKRSLFIYKRTTERIAFSAEDPVFGNVEVRWRGTPVDNLYFTTIDLTNASIRDYQNVRFKIFVSDSVTILQDSSGLVGATEIIVHSPDFTDRFSVAEGGTLTPTQINNYLREREYIVPIFNRNNTVQTRVLSMSRQGEPLIFVELIHPGTKLRYQPNYQKIYGVPVSVTLPLGMIIWGLSIPLITSLSSSSWITVTIAAAVGLLAQLMAVVVYKFFKKLHSLLTD